MSFIELAKARYSVRQFEDTPVEQDKLEKILEAGIVAPTAKNCQPQKVFVLQSAEAIAKINEVSPCIYGAPLVFVIGYDKTRAACVSDRDNYNFGEMDSSIVCTHMMLEAAELGLGSCWVGRFNDVQVSKVLGLPENVQVTALLPVGYAAEGCEPSDRHASYRPKEEMIEYL